MNIFEVLFVGARSSQYEGIDDDASFTQHIADEANASEDENPAWDSSDYSSGDFELASVLRR